MKSLQILDVTLRDGGCVNNFDFGRAYMEKILAAQEAAGVEVIELGYLDGVKGSHFGRTQYINEKVIPQSILKDKKEGRTYVAMIDHGCFDLDTLGMRATEGIDGIRLAFHKKDRLEAIQQGRKIIEKGYSLYIQPMLTLRYTDSELLELIELVNEELPDATAFYIVDSFGEMRPNDVTRIASLVDNNLLFDISLGFHSHNNLQLSYSNSIELLRFPIQRDLILDASIMGMGKGAGNLNTELLIEHLNLFYGKQYRIEPLLEVIDKVINQLHDEFYWGYAPEYYLSATNQCSPNYAKHFYDKHMLPIDQVGDLLRLIEPDKKISFDKLYAEQLYLDYNEARAVDDSDVIKDLSNELEGKTVLLVAPGKSIKAFKAELDQWLGKADILSIGLNVDVGEKVDYILTTRRDVYEAGLRAGRALIVPSSVSKGGRGNVKILNYADHIEIGENGQVYDSSGDIAFDLLKACNVQNVLLAGFDGFSLNINENYFDPELRHPINAVQVESRNRHFKELVAALRANGIMIQFLTPSKYEEKY